MVPKTQHFILNIDITLAEMRCNDRDVLQSCCHFWSSKPLLSERIVSPHSFEPMMDGRAEGS